MRKLLLLAISFATATASTIACDRSPQSSFPFPTRPTQTPSVPTAPVPTPPTPAPPGPYPPSGYPGAPFSENYTPIAVGTVVTGQVSADDPVCVGEPAWQCKYFRITAPADGVIEIVYTVLPHPTRRPNIDLSFTDPELRQWWAPVTARVKAGVTYQITLWEYEFPGAEFELQASLREE